MTDKQAWIKAACPAAAQAVKGKRKPFLIEQIRTEVADKIEQPAELRWWGEVTQWLKRQGLIFRFDSAPARSSNHSPKPTGVAGTAKSARGG